MSDWLERIVSNHFSSVEQESLLARIWCDRCGAVIAAPQEEMGEALDDNGWTADAFGDFTCGNCHLRDVLNSDDTSGEATDAAALAVHQLRVRAGQAEAAIARVREVPASQIVGSDGHVRDMLLRADVLSALDDSEDALVQACHRENQRKQRAAKKGQDSPCRDGKHSSCVGGPCQCPCHELAAS